MAHYFKLIALSALIGIALPVSQALSQAPNDYEKALPKAIGVTAVVRAGNDNSWYQKLLPFPHQTCGAVIYRLSHKTIANIHKYGLSFFKTAHQGRGYPRDNHVGWNYSYADWSETPVPKGWVGDGPLTTYLKCSGIGVLETREIERDASHYGSYYTTKPDGALIVLPDDGIAVLGFYG